MKKYIALCLSICLVLPSFVNASTEFGSDRFEQYNAKATSVYVIKDHKTNCEYLYSANGAIEFVRGSCDKPEDNKDMGDKK